VTSIKRRPQNYIVTNINNAAAIDCGNEQSLVLHGLFLKRINQRRNRLVQVLLGKFS